MLRAVRFGNASVARQWVAQCDDSELEAAERACIHYDRPIRIREIVKQLILVNPANTTQTCHVCGAVSKGEDRILLGTEEWVCPKCLAYHLRDLNAAVNIRDIGFLQFTEQTETVRSA